MDGNFVNILERTHEIEEKEYRFTRIFQQENKYQFKNMGLHVRGRVNRMNTRFARNLISLLVEKQFYILMMSFVLKHRVPDAPNNNNFPSLIL